MTHSYLEESPGDRTTQDSPALPTNVWIPSDDDTSGTIVHDSIPEALSSSAPIIDSNRVIQDGDKLTSTGRSVNYVDINPVI